MNALHLAQSLLGASVPVLCYHQVRPDSGMTPEKFGRQLDLIQKLGFQTISLAHLHDVITGRKKLQTPSVVVTFDDCTLDNWVYAVPELLRRGMRGVFFAITDFLVPGQPRPRADQTDRPETVPSFFEIMRSALDGRCAGFMNQAEIRTLVHDLGMEVYAHSAAHQACFIDTRRVGVLDENRHWSHAALNAPNAPANTPVYPVGSAYAHTGFGQDWRGQTLELCTAEQRHAFCLDDFSHAKMQLETTLERPCPFLCLPWGQHDDVTLNAANQAGYSGVLTLDRVAVGQGTDPMRIGRTAVKERKSDLWLILKILTLALKPLAFLAGGKKQP
jgi:peptidoglycan/xylan/chitin deacetylase (PgdA/CDA1 family)